jgi:hypothetical protein
MSSKNRARGKSLERFIAKDLGGERIGILGKEDVVVHHGCFSLETKERKVIPVFIWKSMEQAERNAAKRGYRPGVVLHRLGQDHGKDIVILKYEDFKSLIKQKQ